MNIKALISEWIRLSNAFDTDLYMEKYTEDAVLDDPSVGRIFIGHAGIRDYFTSYFVGYQTQTRLMTMDIRNNNTALLKVEFTGIFPEGKISGMFDMTFRDGKIATIKANLI